MGRHGDRPDRPRQGVLRRQHRGPQLADPDQQRPAGSNAANITTQVAQADVTRAQQIARDVYNFDAGNAAQSGKETDLKLFGKVDWFIDSKNHAVFEYQRTKGNQIQLGNSWTPARLPLSSDWYNSTQTLDTFSGRVFSNWTDKLSTEVEANAKLVSSKVPPLNGNDFMQATINIGTTMQPGGIGSIVLGPDASRHSNSLSNDVYHGKAEANYLEGVNLITGGVEYEITNINNLFLQNTNGTATYNSLDDFANKNPSRLVYQNSTTLTPSDAAANWGYGVGSAYLQDQIKLTPDLTLQAGLRYERYATGDHPVRNQTFVNRHGFGNNNTLDGLDILEPRLGISWLPVKNLNIRAGGGLYSGGTPGVWMSNNYTNDGVRTFSGTFTPTNAPTIVGFDGRNIPQALQDAIKNGRNNGNVDSLDPNFKLPSVWKLGTGADYSLDIPNAGEYGRNIELKLNYTFTKVNHGVTWSDLRRNYSDAQFQNNTPIGQTPDGRPLYSANFNTARGVDMMLTNDDRGYGHVGSIQVQKGFPFGLYVSGSYTYTDNQEVNPGTSSVSTSNYGITAITDPEHPALADSNYARSHRFTGALEYSHSIIGEFTDSAPWKDMKTSFGLFAESRSGQPYSWTFGGGDTSGVNLSKIFGEDASIANRGRELFYVPTDAQVCEGAVAMQGCSVRLSGISRVDFNKFLDRTGLAAYRGRIAPRNGFKSPRYNRIDIRLSQDLPNPIAGHRAQFFVDIENFGNLLSNSWGVSRQTAFPYYTQAVDVAVDRTNNSYVYSGLRSANPTQVDLLNSVWKISIGLMYNF